MTTILANYDSTQLQTALESAKITIDTLFNPVDFSAIGGLNFAGTPLHLNGINLVLGGSTAGVYAVFTGSGLGYSLALNTPTGTITSLDIYQNGVYSGEPNYTVTGTPVGKLTLSGTQFQLKMYDPAGSGTLLSTMTITGTLPTSAAAAAALFGFNVGGTAIAGSGTIALTGMNYTDSAGNTFAFNSTGLTITVPQSVTGGHGYTLQMTGTFPISLSAANIKTILDGSFAPLTQTVTSIKFFDTTLDPALTAPLASLTGLPTGTTLSTLLHGLESSNFSSLFTSQDVFDASGVTGGGVNMNLGNPMGNPGQFAVETVIGSSGDDVLTGSTGSETMIGGAGNDVLSGQDAGGVTLSGNVLFTNGGVSNLASKSVMSNDGKYMYFVSPDSRLGTTTLGTSNTGDGTSTGTWNFWRYDTTTNVVTKLNVTPTGTGSAYTNTEGVTPYTSQNFDVSADGKYAIFTVNGTLYLNTLATNTVTKIADSVNAWGGLAVRTVDDGSASIFYMDYTGHPTQYSHGTTMVNPTGDTSLAASADGSQIFSGSQNEQTIFNGNNSTFYNFYFNLGANVSVKSISNDGRYLLAVNQNTNGDNSYRAVHLWDVIAGTDTFIGYDRNWADPTMSADGRYVIYQTPENSTDGGYQTYQFDRTTGLSTILSVGPNGETNGGIGNTAISANGQYVGMLGWADLLPNVTTDSGAQVLVYDRTAAVPGSTSTDTLVGGAGSDTLTGGAGSNVFVYNAVIEGGDTITNFESGRDKISLLGGNVWGLGSNPAVGTSFLGTTGSAYLYSTANQLHHVSAAGIDTIIATTTGATVVSGDVTTAPNVVAPTAGAIIDLTNETTVDVVRAAVSGTTFIAGAANLSSTASIIGSAGIDTLQLTDAAVDLSGFTLSSVEVIKAPTSGDTSYTLSQGNLATNGSVIGNGDSNTIVAAGASLSLTSTTLSSIEVIKAGLTTATTFTVDQVDLAAGGSVVGNNGADTLIVNGGTINLGSTTLSSVEIIKAGSIAATTFTVDQTDLAVDGSIIGNISLDTLIAAGTTLDLTNTTLSSVEVLKAGVTGATTFTVDQADLTTTNSQVIGNAGADTLATSGNSLNLSATTLTSIEVLKATSLSDTLFTVDQVDLATNGSVIGNAGIDTLVVNGTAVNLATTTLSGIDVIKAASALATTFTVNQDDLAAGGSVVGNIGTDTIAIAGSSLNLSGTTLSSIETVKAGLTTATIFSVSQTNLGTLGSVVGSAGIDTLVATDITLNLSGTTLTGIEVLKAGVGAGSTITVDQVDLFSGGSVLGNVAFDTLAAAGTTLNLANTTVSSIEMLMAGNTGATTFTVNQADLAAAGWVVGNAGSDTLAAAGNSLDLSDTMLSSIEIIKAGTAATTLTLNQDDLISGGSVVGSAGIDTLVAADVVLNLGSTTLSSIEVLKAGNATATTFTVDQVDLATGGSVIGNAGADTLAITGTSLTLTGTSLSGVEVLKAANTSATTFTVDQADLATNGSVVGNAGIDTLVVGGAAVDLRTTTLSSVEIIKAATAGATTFTLAQTALNAGGSVIGTGGLDTIVAAGASLDLSGTTLSSIETIKAGLTTATSFTVDQADLATNVIGTAGTDTLVAAGTTLTLTATTLSSVEILSAGTTGNTTFTVDQADLAANGSVIGNAGTDTLVVSATAVNLGTTTTLSSVEVIQAGMTGATTFTLSQSALAANGSVVGNAGIDTIVAAGTSLDVSQTTLSSIEVLKAGNAATTFTINTAGLPGSIIGTAGIDTLVADGTVDFSVTTLSGVEIIKVTGNAATVTLDQANLLPGGSVTGMAGNDLLTLTGASIDLSKTTLSGFSAIDATAITGTSTLAGGTGAQTLTGGTGVTTYVYNVASDGGDTITNFHVGDKILFNGTWALGGNWSSNFGADPGAQPYLYTTGNELHYVSATDVDTLIATTTGVTVSASDINVRSNVANASAAAVNLISGSYAGFSTASPFDITQPVDLFQALSATPTTVTATMAALSSYATLIGSSGNDILQFNDTQVDVSRLTLTSIETIKANNTAATTITVAQGNLANNGSVVGNSGLDTLVASGSSLDLSVTALTGVEVIKAGLTTATTFTVDQADLATVNGAIIGTAGVDTLVGAGTTLNLGATTLSSIEIIKAGNTGATTITVDQDDLAVGGSVIGNSGTDILVADGAGLDLTQTTVSGIEVLKAGTAAATSFTVDQADLAASGSVVGSAVIDTLTVMDVTVDLTATTLSSVEIIAAGAEAATVFLVDQADLAVNGRVIGSSGLDTLVANGPLLDLGATTLTSVEILQAGSAAATTFRLDQTDLASGGAVIGNVGTDTIVATGASLNLASTTLSSIEIIKAGSTAATTVTVAQANLATGGSIIGNIGADTLVVTDTTVNLSNTTLSGVEVVKAGGATATTFTLSQGNLTNSLIGTSGIDTLVAAGTSLNLTATTLSSVDVLRAGAGAATTFTLGQNNLASITSVAGSVGTDTLVVTGTAINLTNTTLSSIEVVKATGNTATTFTMSQAALLADGTVIGSAGIDTLVVAGTAVDLSRTTLSSLEVIKASGTAATSFTLTQANLATGGSIIGSTGTDTLVAAAATLDLTATSLSSIEVIKAGARAATTILVDQADLAVGGSVVGSAGSDTLVAVGGMLDLSRTTVSGVEVLKAGTAAATTFTVNQEDLAAGGTIIGARNSDTLVIAGTALDLTATTLSGVEVIKAGTAAATTFTVNLTDLAANGSIVGTAAKDTLVVMDTSVNLGTTTLSSVEVITAGAGTATTFTLTQANLAATGGSVIGTNGIDTIIAAGTSLTLGTTTLSGIEVIQAGNTGNTTLTVAQGDLLAGGSVTGNTGTDTLVVAGTSLDLTATTVSGMEVIKAGTVAATTFTVDQTDLAANGSVVGNTGIDTLIVAGTSVDLSTTTLTSVEVLKAGAGGTTFTLNQAALAANGLVIGTNGLDTIVAAGTSLDLGATTLSSIELIKAGNTGDTILSVSQGNLLVGGAVTGNTGTDTLVSKGANLDLTNTTLSGIEVLAAGLTTATTFTVDQADLAVVTSVVGNAGIDTLVVAGTSVNLGAVTLSGIEVLKAATTGATTFSVDQTDLAAGGSVIGNLGRDTLAILGTDLSLAATTLSGIEVIKATNTAATTITVDQGDLAAGGSVIGNAGSDTLVAAGTTLTLVGTTLSSIEVIQAGSTSATTITVAQGDLAAGGSVVGNAGTDTLVITGTSVNLTDTTLSGMEVIKAGTAAATTFTVNQADLATNGSIVGTAAIDTLVVTDATVDLGATTLSSVEVIKAGAGAATNFTLTQAALATTGGAVIGTTGLDTIVAAGTSLNLGATTLSGIEVIQAGNTANTTLTVTQGNLLAGGSVTGNTGTDTLTVAGASLNLTNTTVTSMEVLKAGTTGATTFTVDQDDLAANGSVVGSTGIDTLIVADTSVDLGTTTLSSVEVLRTTATTATTFTLSQAALATGGSVIGTNGIDTIVAAGTSLDLGATTLSAIEVIKAGTVGNTTFTVDLADLAVNGSVIGNTGIDTLAVKAATVNLTTTTLSSIEVLAAGLTTATTFTLGQAGLAAITSIAGSAGIDTIVATGAGLDLSGTTLSGVEIVKTLATTGATLLGSTGAETIMGGTGADTLNGGGGTDTLIGGGGSDTYGFGTGSFGTTTVVNTGSGTIDFSQTTVGLLSVSRGGTGNLNAVFSFSGDNTVTVTNQFGTAVGSAGTGAVTAVTLADGQTYSLLPGLTNAGAGNAIMAGTTGADTLTVSGSGNTLLFGGAGNDTYVVGNNSFGTIAVQDSAGTDSLDMGYVSLPLTFVARSGDDLTLSYGADKTVTIANQFAGQAIETLLTPYEAYTIQTGLTGTSGVNNLIVGENGTANVITANSDGNNLLFGGDGADTITGGAGDDYLDGGTGANTLIGGGGSDTFSTANSDAGTTNLLTGGAGNDTFLLSGAGTTTIDASAGGADTYTVSDSFGTVVINNATRTSGSVINIDNQITSDPISFARSGNDLVIGFSDGSSTLTITNQYDGGGHGIDSIVGHGETLTIQTSDLTGDTDSTIIVAGPGDSTITGSTNGGDMLFGGTGNDTITGSAAGNEVMWGAAGTDTITAQGANNTLGGGDGADILTAGSGVTVFAYNNAGEGGDTITGFTTGTDKIAVVSANFEGLTAGTLAAANFVSGAGATATGGAATFLYDTDAFTLSFDADGTGVGVAVTIATFGDNAILTNNDILVVNRSLVGGM